LVRLVRGIVSASTGNFIFLGIASPLVTLSGGGKVTLPNSFYKAILASATGSLMTNVNKPSLAPATLATTLAAPT